MRRGVVDREKKEEVLEPPDPRGSFYEPITHHPCLSLQLSDLTLTTRRKKRGRGKMMYGEGWDKSKTEKKEESAIQNQPPKLQALVYDILPPGTGTASLGACQPPNPFVHTHTHTHTHARTHRRTHARAHTHTLYI